MSTRACYRFIEDNGENPVTVYKHHDGYPSGAAQHIAKALPLAWDLPRFEADEFAAAFVAANKDQAGGVRLIAKSGINAFKTFAADIEYLYDISYKKDALHVTTYETSCSMSGKWTVKRIFDGTLAEMTDQFGTL